MSASFGANFNKIARVHFNDANTLQAAGFIKDAEHDIFILGTESTDDLMVSLWIDLGYGGLPVATEYQSTREVILTPVYQNRSFRRKPSAEELTSLFQYVFDHPEILDSILSIDF